MPNDYLDLLEEVERAAGDLLALLDAGSRVPRLNPSQCHDKKKTTNTTREQTGTGNFI